MEVVESKKTTPALQPSPEPKHHVDSQQEEENINNENFLSADETINAMLSKLPKNFSGIRSLGKVSPAPSAYSRNSGESLLDKTVD